MTAVSRESLKLLFELGDPLDPDTFGTLLDSVLMPEDNPQVLDLPAALASLLASLPTTEPLAPNSLWLSDRRLALSVGIPPVVTTQPVAVGPVAYGMAVSYSIVASHATSYQWQSSLDNEVWQDISNEHQDNYMFIAEPASANYFRCRAIGPGGTTNSNSAALTIS